MKKITNSIAVAEKSRGALCYLGLQVTQKQSELDVTLIYLLTQPSVCLYSISASEITTLWWDICILLLFIDGLSVNVLLCMFAWRLRNESERVNDCSAFRLCIADKDRDFLLDESKWPSGQLMLLYQNGFTKIQLEENRSQQPLLWLAELLESKMFPVSRKLITRFIAVKLVFFTAHVHRCLSTLLVFSGENVWIFLQENRK